MTSTSRSTWRASASAIVAEAQEAVAAAQRANVNVYGIDPRGLSQFSGLVDISARSDYPQLEYGTFRGALRELRAVAGEPDLAV